MPVFQGGPLDGQLGYAPGIDPPADQLAAGATQGQDQSQSEDDLDPTARFDRILSDARLLASSDGDFSEQDKLVLEKVTSLLQQLKAASEKEQDQMMQGKFSPGAMRKATGGGGSY